MAGNSSSPRWRWALIAGAVAVALVAAVIVVLTRGGGQTTTTGPGETSSPGGPGTATTTPKPSPTRVASPLNGLPVAPGRPVLAVKIDNVRAARPPIGLTDADVVYLEPVEGGLSRLLAVFSRKLPRTIGPVRSARESDLELLRQYGRPGLVYSGANKGVLAQIRRAPVVDLSPATVGGAYRRLSGRSAPHNLAVDPDRLLARADRVSPARDIGFRFGAAPAGGTPATKPVSVRYGAARTTVTWSAKAKKFLVSMDGSPARAAEGGQLGASTVVVQNTTIRSSRFRDSAGNPTPYAETVGSGTALVLRDGVTFQARWSRRSADSGTTFTTATGAPLPFAAGQVWVLLASK
jgi:hypothetical protein